MSEFPKRTHYDADTDTDKALSRLARVLESTPDVVRYKVAPLWHLFRAREIFVSVEFETWRGRNARFGTTIATAAALDISRADLLHLFAEYMRRFVKRHDERIAKALRTLPCGHRDATDDALRVGLPCGQCASDPLFLALDIGEGLSTTWPEILEGPTWSPVPTIPFRCERFILPNGELVTRWERSELTTEDEVAEERE